MVVRRATRQRQGFNADHLHHLRAGFDYFGNGFTRPDGSEPSGGEVVPGMAECWEQHSTEVLAAELEHCPGTRPWAWWVFEGYVPEGVTDIDRHLGMSEADWLAARGLLSADELRRVNEPAHLQHLGTVRRHLAAQAGDPDADPINHTRWGKYLYPVVQKSN